MQLFVWSNKRTVGNDVSWRYNLIDIPIDIKEIWMKINLSLAKEDIEDPLNTWNTVLIEKCIDYLSNKKMFVRVWAEEFELDRWALAYLVSDLALSAFDCWKNVWRVNVDMPKEYLWQFKKDNKEVLDKINDIEKKKKEVIKKPKEENEITLKDVYDLVKNINVGTVIVNKEIPQQQESISVWRTQWTSIDESMNSEFKGKWVRRSDLDF